MAEPRVLKLQSPAYGESIFYKWPLVNTKKHDEASEITETIRLVCEDFPELKYAVENFILNEYDATDYDSMNQLCQRYNKAIRNILSLWKGRAPPPRMFKPPNKELLKHIINLCYSHAIKEPEKLNLYEPFSPEVYGETSFDMVAQILEECQNANDETFIDLGSGVGQVVLQAAASNQFKECFGVEKADTPAKYAQAMEREFKRWMDWFGKIYTDFTLEKGDFLENKWQDVINNCGVVFVNNFAFGPVVNHHLKQRFQQMKEGARIISSREYCPLNFKFNKRNLSELGAMMRVTEMKPKSEEQTVSWTGNTVSYYLHVIDRTRLEKYFSILKKKKEGTELDEDELSIYSESNLSADTTGTPKYEETLEENLDGLYLGTTTRHQWQVLNDTIQQSRKEVKHRKKNSRTSIEEKDKNIKQKRKKPGRPPNLLKSAGHIQLKNKILQKYGYQKMKKSSHEQKKRENKIKKNMSLKDRSCSSSSVDVVGSDDTHDELVNKTPRKKRIKNPKKKTRKDNTVLKINKKQASIGKNQEPSEESLNCLDKEVDQFYDNMKQRCKEFIKRINTKEYADRLKVMIECEQTKKKLLQREVSETEQQVQNLRNTGLKSFSSQLTELDLVVKTPLELLSKSSMLADRRQELENKVMNMEVEVYNLEEKYKNMCTAKEREYQQAFVMGAPTDLVELELLDENEITDRKNQLTTKLCGAIVNALNQRRSLIDKQSSLAEQITILEKMASPQVEDTETFLPEDERPPKEIPKSRPVAFVPPRMLSDDGKSTVSPPEVSSEATPPTSTETQRRPRGRPRKRPKQEGRTILDRSLSTQSDSSQDSKMDYSGGMDEMPGSYDEEFEGDSDNHNSRDINHQSAATFQHTSLRSAPQNMHKNYNVFQALEQREPIVFPPNKDLTDAGDDTESIKEFLKASSKLLEAESLSAKWRPLEELKASVEKHSDSKIKYFDEIPITDEHKTTSCNSKSNITNSTIISRDNFSSDMPLLTEPALHYYHHTPSIFSPTLSIPPKYHRTSFGISPPQLPLSGTVFTSLSNTAPAPHQASNRSVIQSPSPMSSLLNAEILQTSNNTNITKQLSIDAEHLQLQQQQHYLQQQHLQQQHKHELQQHHSKAFSLTSPPSIIGTIKQPTTTYIPAITSKKGTGGENPTASENSHWQTPKYNIYDNVQLAFSSYQNLLSKKNLVNPSIFTTFTTTNVTNDQTTIHNTTVGAAKNSSPIKFIRGLDVKCKNKVPETQFLLHRNTSRQPLVTNLPQLPCILNNKMLLQQAELLRQQQQQQSHFNQLPQHILISSIAQQHQQQQQHPHQQIQILDASQILTTKNKLVNKKEKQGTKTQKSARKRKSQELYLPAKNLMLNSVSLEPHCNVSTLAKEESNKSNTSVDYHFKSSLDLLYQKDAPTGKRVLQSPGQQRNAAIINESLPPASKYHKISQSTTSQSSPSKQQLSNGESVSNILRNVTFAGKLPNVTKDYILQQLPIVTNLNKNPFAATTTTITRNNFPQEIKTVNSTIESSVPYNYQHQDSTIDTTGVFQVQNISSINKQKIPNQLQKYPQKSLSNNNTSLQSRLIEQTISSTQQKLAAPGQSVIYHTKEPQPRQQQRSTDDATRGNSLAPHITANVIKSNLSLAPANNVCETGEMKTLSVLPTRAITDLHSLAAVLQQQPVSKKTRKGKKKKPTNPQTSFPKAVTSTVRPTSLPMSVIPANEMHRTMILTTPQPNITFLNVASNSSLMRPESVLTGSSPVAPLIGCTPGTLQAPVLQNLEPDMRKTKTMKSIQPTGRTLINQRGVSSIVNQPHFVILPVSASVPQHITVQSTVGDTTSRQPSTTTSPTYPPPHTTTE